MIGKPLRTIAPTKSVQKRYSSKVRYAKPIQSTAKTLAVQQQDLFRSGAWFARNTKDTDIKDLKNWTKKSKKKIKDSDFGEVQHGFDSEQRNNPNKVKGVRYGGKRRYHADKSEFTEFKGLK